MNSQAYPLDWPVGWKRTSLRSRAKFKGRQGGYEVVGYTNGQPDKRWRGAEGVTISQGVQRVLDELSRFGVQSHHVTISTNLGLRNDGLPRSGQPAPRDPGAAVYWKVGKQQRCMAIDQYDRVADNLAAIAATLDAMRAIERHGGAAILDRAFSGFAALPAPEQPFQVLGIGHDATPAQVRDAYKRLASMNHPDKGGDSDKMARINQARDAMLGDA